METLHRPKKRICPSLSASNCSNTRRHRMGDKKGNNPSMTSSRASAIQRLLPSSTTAYFFAGAAAALAPLPDPRMDLKKSLEGSSTITSLFLLKLDL